MTVTDLSYLYYIQKQQVYKKEENNMASTVMGNMLSLDNQIDVDVYARGEDGRGIYDQIVEFQASNDPVSVPSGT
jgi:hypothetical protein